VKATPTARGVLLSWAATPGAAGYRILRAGPDEKTPVEIGTSSTTDYLDTTAEYDTRYVYTAIATEGSAESLASKPEIITPVDKFAPSVPASITVLPAPNAIEVTWQRSPEPDLKGYYLYRSVNNAPFERIGPLLTLPTYSDRSVEHGKTYRYQVSAVDRKNNESARSNPAETAF
jgi:fibronectin type 3 domain-containing protein